MNLNYVILLKVIIVLVILNLSFEGIKKLISFLKIKRLRKKESIYPFYGQNGTLFYEIQQNGIRHNFEQWELDAKIQYFYREFLNGVKLNGKQLQLIRWYCDTFSQAKWTLQSNEMLKNAP